MFRGSFQMRLMVLQRSPMDWIHHILTMVKVYQIPTILKVTHLATVGCTVNELDLNVAHSIARTQQCSKRMRRYWNGCCDESLLSKRVMTWQQWDALSTNVHWSHCYIFHSKDSVVFKKEYIETEMVAMMYYHSTKSDTFALSKRKLQKNTKWFKLKRKRQAECYKGSRL